MTRFGELTLAINNCPNVYRFDEKLNDINNTIIDLADAKSLHTSR